jgi:hypothetical protein
MEKTAQRKMSCFVLSIKEMKLWVWERREMNTKFWLENLKGRENSENVGVDDKITLEWISGK